jgi:hypothetical protein
MLVILMGRFYEVCPSDALTCHDVRTEFHEDCLRHSEILEAKKRKHKSQIKREDHRRDVGGSE